MTSQEIELTAPPAEAWGAVKAPPMLAGWLTNGRLEAFPESVDLNGVIDFKLRFRSFPTQSVSASCVSFFRTCSLSGQ